MAAQRRNKRLRIHDFVRGAEECQRLLGIAAQADAEEGIRQGLDDVSHGRFCSAKEVFDDVRRKYGIPSA